MSGRNEPRAFLARRDAASTAGVQVRLARWL